MSCYGCSTKFNLINKEKACKNCGYSYCRSCLKYSIPVPKRQNAVCEVCHRCFTQLSKGPSNAEPPLELPKNFVKQVEERLKRENAHSGASGNRQLNASVNDADEIRARLDALRVSNLTASQANSEEAIRSRLEAIKMNPSTSQSQSNAIPTAKTNTQSSTMTSSNGLFVVPPPRSEVDQVDDLLDAIMNEVRMDEAMPDAAWGSGASASETEESIAARLARLATDANQLGVPQVDVDAVLLNTTRNNNYGRIETVRLDAIRRKGGRNMQMDDDDDDDEANALAFECTLCGAGKQLELFTCRQCEDVRRVCAVCFRALHNAADYEFLRSHTVQRVLLG